MSGGTPLSSILTTRTNTQTRRGLNGTTEEALRIGPEYIWKIRRRKADRALVGIRTEITFRYRRVKTIERGVPTSSQALVDPRRLLIYPRDASVIFRGVVSVYGKLVIRPRGGYLTLEPIPKTLVDEGGVKSQSRAFAGDGPDSLLRTSVLPMGLGAVKTS